MPEPGTFFQTPVTVVDELRDMAKTHPHRFSYQKYPQKYCQRYFRFGCIDVSC
jgi:hypothetical protein